MNQHLFMTILLATGIMVLVIFCLCIGLILTGKSRLRKRCGWNPEKKKNPDSDSCNLCGSKKRCDDDEPGPK